MHADDTEDHFTKESNNGNKEQETGYGPDFTNPEQVLIDLSETFEEHLEDYYTRYDVNPRVIAATDNPTGFVADFPGGRKLRVSMTVEDQATSRGDVPSSVPYLYMNTIFVNKRADEYVASCMVHTDNGEQDVTVEASHTSPKDAHDKLSRALTGMGVSLTEPAPDKE